MIIIILFMLLVPGLIAVRIHWRERQVSRGDYKYVLCDYFIYSFIIMVFNYAVMFLSYPERSVSFSMHAISFSSNIYSASFIFKYSFISLILSVFLPKIWRILRNRFPKL